MAERFEFACGALQGTAHALRGEPCQDRDRKSVV